MAQGDVHTSFIVDNLVSTPHSGAQPTAQSEPYIHILSSDVLIEIFSILFDEQNWDYEEDDMPLQYSLSTVCREWRELIVNTPLLWNIINTSSNSPFDPTLFFERSTPALIDVYYFIQPASGWFSLEKTHEPRISKVISANFPRIRTFGISATHDTEIYEFFLVMKEPVNLTTLKITSGYTSTDFSRPFPIDTSNIKRLQLTEFSFEGFSTLTNLTSLTVDKLKTDLQTFQALFDNSPSLETLVIRQFGTPQIAVNHNAGINGTQIDAPSLRHLAINIDKNHTSDCKCSLPFLFAPNLQRLEMTYGWLAFTTHHKAMFEHLKEFPKLQKLRIRSESIWLEADISFLSSLPATTELEVIGFPRTAPASPALLYILNLSNVRSITVDLNFHQKPRISLDSQMFLDIIHDKLPTLRCPVSLRSHFEAESLTGHPLRAMLGNMLTLLRISTGKGLLDDYVDCQRFDRGLLDWEAQFDEDGDYGDYAEYEDADDTFIDHGYGEYDSDDFDDRTQDHYDEDDIDVYQSHFGGRNGHVDELEYSGEQYEFEDSYEDYVGYY